ncbi:FHA domain-containing protein, partial [bacterium]|nr:FHA domain-containing protein [bacterium]
MSAAAAPVADPWGWLLGRTASGAWRHAPFRALDPGQGQDPSLEPRVEVVRRLIAYPSRTFAAVIAAIAASDRDRKHPIQWVCHRSTGEAPARPYWLTFLRAKEAKGRRFYVGLELFDRERLGLWFFSGFLEKAVPRQAWAPFPEQPRVSLPRFEVGDEAMLGHAFEQWIPLAFHDALLSFELADQATAADEGVRPRADPLNQPMPPPSQGIRTGAIVDQSLVLDSIPHPAPAVPQPSRAARPSEGYAIAQEPAEPPPDLRTAKARIVICVQGRAPTITPLARVTTVLGRDPRCDLVIDDKSVSSEHARITYRDGTPTVDDMGSKNGTRLGSAVLRKTEPPHVLGDEVFLGLGRVGCVFVRDAEETLLPGQPRPIRHRAKVDELVARGRLSREAAQKAFEEARSRGITPGEVLLLNRTFPPEEWTGAPPLPPKPGSCGCVVLFFLLLLAGIASATLSGCHS